MLGDTPRRPKFIDSSAARVASRSDKPCFKNELYIAIRVPASPSIANSSSLAIANSQPVLPDASCSIIFCISSGAPVITCPPRTPRACNLRKASLSPENIFLISPIVSTTGLMFAPVVSAAAKESRKIWRSA